MKKIYIVDDDDYKVKQLEKHLPKNVVLKRFTYRNELLRQLLVKESECGLLILDMTFPLLKDTLPESGMGISVLSEIKRKKYKMPVLVHSSDKVDVSEYDNVVGYIQHSPFVVFPEEYLNNILEKCGFIL